MAIFLSQDSIDRGEVFGNFFKCQYTNNGYTCFVYCHNEKDFLKLVNSWNDQSQRVMGGKYFYVATGPCTPIALRDIPYDGSRKVKIFLQCSYTGVYYIS